MKKKVQEIPSIDDIKAELHRIKYRRSYRNIIRNTLYTLITVAAIAVLVATLWMPVLQTHGSSMTPTLRDNNIVVSVKNGEVNYGDIIAFYYNNKILIKRVIALPGDWIDIKQDGTVYVNGSICNEPYISEKAFGDCNIEMPYQVPDAKYFVMGDHRLTSTDSRNSALGCVSEEQIVGRILFRVWPLNEIGRIE